MRVFLCSTVFDLIDVRAEVAELLRSLGVTPVLSDDKLSDFTVHFDVNSIETCLINLETCDEVIVVLDKRYGPSLESAGFGDVSATHLEYRHAVKHKKPIHFFVRDRLEADYTIWKKNRRSKDLNLPWVQPKDYGLFKLLSEHSKLKSRPKSSNWYTRFTASVDLKASLRRSLETIMLPRQLVDAIYENKFPLFNVDLRPELVTLDVAPDISFKCTITNIGSAAAFNFIASWKDAPDDKSSKGIMAPGQSFSMCFIYRACREKMGTERHLMLEYDSALGVAVVDDFRISGRVRPGPQRMIVSGAVLHKRTFKRVEKPIIEVEGL